MLFRMHNYFYGQEISGGSSTGDLQGIARLQMSMLLSTCKSRTDIEVFMFLNLIWSSRDRQCTVGDRRHQLRILMLIQRASYCKASSARLRCRNTHDLTPKTYCYMIPITGRVRRPVYNKLLPHRSTDAKP
jgi:hypothetical protein